MTDTVSIITRMSTTVPISTGAYTPDLPISGSTFSTPSPAIPVPSGEVMRLTFGFASAAESNPVLWRLDMEFSQDDSDEMARLMERGVERAVWTPELIRAQDEDAPV